MAIDSINGAASPIAGAIRDAARTTGASVEYLLTTAQIESNLNQRRRPRRPRPAGSASSSTKRGSRS